MAAARRASARARSASSSSSLKVIWSGSSRSALRPDCARWNCLMIRRSRSISTWLSTTVASRLASAAAMSRTSCCSMVVSVGRLSSAIRMSGGYRSSAVLYIENRSQLSDHQASCLHRRPPLEALQQHRQLRRCQCHRDGAVCLRLRRRPGKRTLIQPLGEQAYAGAVVEQDLEHPSPLATENEEVAAEWICPQHLLHQQGTARRTPCACR